jgi:hypothetical protein
MLSRSTAGGHCRSFLFRQRSIGSTSVLPATSPEEVMIDAEPLSGESTLRDDFDKF